MTAARVPNHPKGYQRPADPPLHDMATVTALLPRLRCGACRGRLSVDPPTSFPGRLYCSDCGREYAEVVDELPTPIRLTVEDFHPPRGRPKRGRPYGSGALDGRWSRDFDACVVCKQTDSPYGARGRCNRCLLRERQDGTGT